MEEEPKISIRIGNSVVDAVLYNNEAARPLAPMPLVMGFTACGDDEPQPQQPTTEQDGNGDVKVTLSIK